MSGALVVALVAPALGLIAAIATPSLQWARRFVQTGGLVASVAWGVLLVRGGAQIGRFDAAPLAAVAGCGTGLLLVTMDLGDRIVTLLTAALAAAVVNAGLASGLAAGDLPVLVATFLVAALLALGTERFDRALVPVALIAAIGFVLLGAGLGILHEETESWKLPRPAASVGSDDLPAAAGGTLLAGAAALVIAGSARRSGPEGPLLVAGAALALRVAPLLGAGGGVGSTVPVVANASAPLPIVAGALAVAAVAAALLRRAPIALGLLGLAATVGPGAGSPPAALLLAAAALSAAIERPGVVLLGVPGAIALAMTLTAAGGALAVGVGAAAIVAAFLLADDVRRRPYGPLPVAAVPAAAVGAWLLLAPGSWSWVGGAGLGAYDHGASRAVAAGMLAIVGIGLWSFTRRGAPRVPPGAPARPWVVPLLEWPPGPGA